MSRIFFQTNKPRPIHQRGVSIIELIIYASLLAVLTIGAVDLIISAYAVVAKARLQQTINTEGELSMQRLLREIRNAYDLDASNSVFDATPGALRVRTYAATGGNATTTADFRVTSGLLHLNKATTSIDLTSSSITIASLIFRNLNATSTPKAVKIELLLTATSPRFSITSPFYGSATLRGSY